MAAGRKKEFKQTTHYLCNTWYQAYEGVLSFSFVFFMPETLPLLQR
jgi:hypothetical protein